MITYPETGYTPANLRHLLGILGMTQAAAANYLGVSDRTVRMWLAETDKPSHTDMPLLQWRKLSALANAD